MKTNRVRVLVMATLGLLAAAACVSPASAQGLAFQGKFTLPSEVSWQGTVLPAGEYSFSMESVASPALMRVSGPNGAHFLMAAGRVEGEQGQQSSLTIDELGGTGYVREMYLAPLGIHLTYRVPKASKDQLIAQAPVTTQHVLISYAAK